MTAKATKLLAALVLTACVSGCNTPKPPTPGATTEAPNPLQISTRTLRHTVHFAPGNITPDAAETASLNEFLRTSEIMRGDSITIERDSDRADDKRADRLASALTRQGLFPAIVSDQQTPSGELRLVIERTVAEAVNCPNWSKAPGNDFDNTLHSDFGCANAANLAAMIADPHDLVTGRTMGAQTGDAALAPIHRYRAGNIPALTDDGAPTPSASAAVVPPSGGQ
jgi:pilus assembly protein CpaD